MQTRTPMVALFTMVILVWCYFTSSHAQIEPEPEVTCKPCTCTKQTMICKGARYLPPPKANITEVEILGALITAEADILGNLTNITLKSLTIKNSAFGADVIFSGGLSHLESLVIDHTVMSSVTIFELAAATAFSPLQRLSVIKPLNPITFEFFDWSCQMKRTFQYFSIVDAALTIQSVWDFIDYSKETYPSCGLRVFNLSSNNLKSWPNSTLDGFQVLEELNLDHNRITEISEFSFASESLQRLTFSNNAYDFARSCEGIFSHSPQLRELDISGNSLVRMTLESLTGLFSANLTLLEKLVIKNSGVLHLPKDIFSNLPKLKTLDLSENELVQWPADVFSRMPSLQILNMSSNAIRVVKETSLPIAAVSMDLSSNPFSCTCDLLWFRRAIPGIQHKLLRFPEGYVCTTPASYAGELVTAMPVDTGGCQASTSQYSSVIIPSAIAAALVLLVIVAALVYFFRKPIIRKIRQSRGLMPYYRMHPSETG